MKPEWPGPIVDLIEEGTDDLVEQVSVGPMRGPTPIREVPSSALFCVPAGWDYEGVWMRVGDDNDPDGDDPEALVYWCQINAEVDD